MANRRLTLDEVIEKKLADSSFRTSFVQHRLTLRLGTEIARLRKNAGVTQNELALKAGMQKQNIARLERPNYQGFTVSTLQRIAAALNCRLEIRFVEIGSSERAQRGSEVASSNAAD